MSKKMLYPTRDQEYQLAGWIGTIQIMQEAGAAVLREELHPHLNGGTLGAYALRICVKLYQKPDQCRGMLRKLFTYPSMRDGDHDYRLALLMIGAAEETAHGLRLVTAFADALDISTDGQTRALIEAETDFFRLETAIAEEVAFNRRSIPRIAENLHTDAYKEVQREIDFYVGLNDPART